MNNPSVEYHPLSPFLPEGAKLLLLGSFPPKQIRWSMNFFYPNMQNDMWRIMGLIFFNNKDHFLTGKKFDEFRIRAFCTEKGIAIGDTAHAVIRLNDNASDKFLEIVESVNLQAILQQLPDCRTIVTTGQKATDTLLPIVAATEPKVGSYTEFTFNDRTMRLYRMPSSSRAYPRSIEAKAAVYGAMFEAIGIK